MVILILTLFALVRLPPRPVTGAPRSPVDLWSVILTIVGQVAWALVPVLLSLLTLAIAAMLAWATPRLVPLIHDHRLQLLALRGCRAVQQTMPTASGSAKYAEVASYIAGKMPGANATDVQKAIDSNVFTLKAAFGSAADILQTEIAAEAAEAAGAAGAAGAADLSSINQAVQTSQAAASAAIQAAAVNVTQAATANGPTHDTVRQLIADALSAYDTTLADKAPEMVANATVDTGASANETPTPLPGGDVTTIRPTSAASPIGEVSVTAPPTATPPS